jgi:hypothetical protein
MRLFFNALILLYFIISNIYCQSGNTSFKVEAIGGYASPEAIPFWLRSNQYGSIPLDGISAGIIGSARKDYIKENKKKFDWGASFEGRLNVGNKIDFSLIEGYGKVKASVFEFLAGRTKEIMGLCDTTLSSGSWAVSGTAIGIPKIQIGIPEFYNLPFWGQIFAFKGQYAHGWLSDKQMFSGDTARVNIKTFFHQVAFYGRLGKPHWKIKLYGGFSHQAIWGHEEEYYNEDFTLSWVETYLYVITGKRYDKGVIQSTRLGNHLGSIDLGLEYQFSTIKLFLYRQNFYEAGALYHLANIQDGLNGISIEHKPDSASVFKWKKFVIEFLYTKNQAGEPWSPPTPSPYENYYNHYQYVEGWSYKGIGLGTPFITPRQYVRDDLPAWPNQYFTNNRVIAFHFGFSGGIKKWDYLLKLSWSINYGTYFTTDQEQTTGIPNPGSHGVFGEKKQLSAFMECSRPIKNGFTIGTLIAFDIGKLFNNSGGIFLNIIKSF